MAATMHDLRPPRAFLAAACDIAELAHKIGSGYQGDVEDFAALVECFNRLYALVVVHAGLEAADACD
jgi:hypothetical protein